MTLSARLAETGAAGGAPPGLRRVSAADPSSTARKTVEILEALAGSTGAVGLSELARHVGSSRSSVLRILSALHGAGLVRRDPATRRYGLTFGLLCLAHSALDHLPWYPLCRARVCDLSARVSSVAHLAVLDGCDVVYLTGVEPVDPPAFAGGAGCRAPAHATAAGRALLAARRPPEIELFLARCPLASRAPRTATSADGFLRALEQVRQRGYAVDDEEMRAGVRCVAAAVRDRRGAAVAAIGVSLPAHRLPDAGVPAVAARVQEAAALASRDLGAPSSWACCEEVQQ